MNFKRFFLLFFIIFTQCAYAQQPLKVLHLSFHSGCTNDFDDVAKELGLNLTTWIPSDQVHFQGEYLGNALYNISRERGRLIWERHKDYFDQFDVVLTSDTTRLSRIFLENGWKKPLVIWVCNRFDYFDSGAQRFGLPDGEYLDTMRSALTQKNVTLISYTPYEHYYARRKGVPFSEDTIKPLGHLPHANSNDNRASVPAAVNKKDTIFLYPRLSDHQSAYIMNECESMDISMYTGSYKGPEDIKDFKAVIYFPYAWSNLALFENIQQGIIHFLPSESFIKNNRQRVRFLTLNQFELCEWYAPENRDLFVYFDSWSDLKEKVATLDYEKKRTEILLRAQQHRSRTLTQWNEVFEKARTQLESEFYFVSNLSIS